MLEWTHYLNATSFTAPVTLSDGRVYADNQPVRELLAKRKP
jgi:hypothetical protein